MSRALNNLSRFFLPDKSGARRRSREIDAMLKLDQRETVLIILAGASYAGKSTVLRQIRLINGTVLNHTELLEFREAIYNNIIQGMRVLVQERNKLGIPLQNSVNEKHEMLFSTFLEWRLKLEPCTFQPYVEAIDSLWKDSGIQEAHLRRSNYELYESVKYYFDNIHRIGQLNYLPHNQDVVYTQKYRTTLADTYFVLRDSPFTFAEFWRSPIIWRCRSNLLKLQMPLLFIIGCSDYDRTIFEDNCLVDSLNGFEHFCAQERFHNCPLILFFNKMDLLAEKVQTSDIRKHFPEFQGDPHRLEDVQEFLVQSFQKRKGNNGRQLFYHMTTAVDTENFRKVFESFKDITMGSILKNTLLL